MNVHGDCVSLQFHKRTPAYSIQDKVERNTQVVPQSYHFSVKLHYCVYIIY